MGKKSYFLFIGVLIFSPLAFGAVEEWSLAIMESLSLLALILLLLRRENSNPGFYEVPGIIPLALLLAYMLLQVIPLPPDFLKMISPRTYSIYEKTVWLESPLKWVSLTINKKETLREFFRIAAYGSFYVLTVQLLAEREQLKKTVLAVVTLAAVVAMFAVFQHLLPNGRIFWLRNVPAYSAPFGPYVNRNHYAGFMEMIFPVVLSLFLYYKPKRHYASWRERVIGFFNGKGLNKHLLLGFFAILIPTSIFLSLSRSGIVSLSIAMIFFGAMLSFLRISQRRKGAVILILFLVVLSVGWFGWQQIFERFEKITEVWETHAGRLVYWKDSMQILKDFPVTGSGFGTFMSIYPHYRSFPGNFTLEHVHNDYMELLAEGGLVSGLMAGCFLYAVLVKSYMVFRKRREPYSLLVYLGSVAGITAIFFHSFTDFNLHIGANGLYFFFLAGLAVSAANTRMREGFDATYLKRIKPFCVKPAAVLLIALLLSTILINAGFIIGAIEFNIATNASSERRDLAEIKKHVSRASFFDPLEARYRYALANAEYSMPDKRVAFAHYRDALGLNPAAGEYQQALGLVFSEFRQFETAERLLRSGIEVDSVTPARYVTYADWLMSKGRREEGMENLRKAVSLEPEKTRDYITVFVLNGETDELIRSLLPRRPESYIQFADYLVSTGNEKMAEEIYAEALNLVGNKTERGAVYLFSIYNFLAKRGRYEDALNVTRIGISLFPHNLQMRFMTADLYEKLGMPHRAEEEYMKALVIDPRNKDALRKLREFSK